MNAAVGESETLKVLTKKTWEGNEEGGFQVVDGLELYMTRRRS